MDLRHCADNFISIVNGQHTALYLLENDSGTIAAFTNFGARWVGFQMENADGSVDPVCGFDAIETYRGLGDAYYGAIVGRYANRIRNGRFEIDGKTFMLPVNNGPNHLHGGPDGLHQVVWAVSGLTRHSIVMIYSSPSGEGGYPGEVQIKVTYSLSQNNELLIEIEASTDEPTILNLTNHAYFNLDGRGSINNHEISIHASRFLPVDETLIPIGSLTPVSGPFDLRKPIKLSDGLHQHNDQLKIAGGYDHCFVLDGTGMKKAATVKSGNTILECFTDQPGLQFYSGNFMRGMNIFRNGEPDGFRTGFCLEAQKFPDSPNQPAFPSAMLRAGEVYSSRTIYRFTGK